MFTRRSGDVQEIMDSSGDFTMLGLHYIKVA